MATSKKQSWKKDPSWVRIMARVSSMETLRFVHGGPDWHEENLPQCVQRLIDTAIRDNDSSLRDKLSELKQPKSTTGCWECGWEMYDRGIDDAAALLKEKGKDVT